MKKFAVIGDPIEHSLSPIMHNAMIKHLGIKATYDKYLVNSSTLLEWLKSDKAIKLDAFNVTMPLKNEFIHHLDIIAPEAKKINAINTVVRKSHKLYGYNTDGIGFIRALEGKGKSPKTNIALIGFGGAASSLAHTLSAHKATISIYTRNPQRFSSNTLYKIYDFSHLSSIKDINILINASSLGMSGQEQFQHFEFLDALNKDCLVCDLVYNPLETLLLSESKKRNLSTMNGLSMLIHQGIAALELFLDTELDIHEMEKVAVQAVENELITRKNT